MPTHKKLAKMESSFLKLFLKSFLKIFLKEEEKEGEGGEEE